MKQFASIVAGAIGFIANVLTLAAFVYSTDWGTPAVRPLESIDWAIWTAVLSSYVAATITATARNLRNIRKSTRPSPTYDVYGIEIITTVLLHVPFSLLLWTFWARAFGHLWFPQLDVLNFFFFYILFITPALTILSEIAYRILYD